ncbi:hypothetical protein HC251_05285 [Iamia sp. SCSIO 61187]|uniref:hypothetical protein n=1 Tax=Iamia sp. SCSIO 61187 TaxID=2722752 RepID=UPI001C625FA5|nr:hypothetical protein [Iamia sp. SCSIO 61187]QYG91910.1 hypothetical protein HC251_05285 [Iamia sp. SCSIO 61187]
MAERNRVTPTGEIVATAQRGLFLGNRGSIHRGHEVVRPWQVRRWITCALAYKGWRAPMWEPGRWTPLFFWDEAVALAAGHRPCALCRHADHVRWMDGWEAATGSRPRVDPVDRVLHDERVGPDRGKRLHDLPWAGLPVGTFAVVDDRPHLVLADHLVPWHARADAYGPPRPRPRTGRATVLTPPSTVAVLRSGYAPVLHPSLARPR